MLTAVESLGGACVNLWIACWVPNTGKHAVKSTLCTQNWSRRSLSVNWAPGWKLNFGSVFPTGHNFGPNPQEIFISHVWSGRVKMKNLWGQVLPTQPRARQPPTQVAPPLKLKSVRILTFSQIEYFLILNIFSHYHINNIFPPAISVSSSAQFAAACFFAWVWWAALKTWEKNYDFLHILILLVLPHHQQLM